MLLAYNQSFVITHDESILLQSPRGDGNSSSLWEHIFFCLLCAWFNLRKETEISNVRHRSAGVPVHRLSVSISARRQTKTAACKTKPAAVFLCLVKIFAPKILRRNLVCHYGDKLI